jgi:spore maturation protein CgeB
MHDVAGGEADRTVSEGRRREERAERPERSERTVSRARAVYRVARRAYRHPHRRPRLVHDVACALLPGWTPPPALRRVLDPARAPGRPAAPRLPKVALPEGPVALPGVRAAVVLDTFSEVAFRYEWDQRALTPQNWRTVMSEFRPHLLFVESAWAAAGGAWRGQMSRGEPGAALRELVAWCRAEGVPTVFWNKEDPPNYDVFLPTARLFDHVLTVDADRIPAYRVDLGHDRVGLLPFAAQPRVHNPVRAGAGRAYDVAFAGTYFAEKHDGRRAQMEFLLRPALGHGLHIFSRMQNAEERYRFPEPYARHVVGSLPYERMPAAYTSYKVFLNVNSVTDSPTMCARRLFELSAAQTAVLSAPSAAIAPYFGGDVEVVEGEEGARLALAALTRHEELRARRGLRAHRRVFDAHLYAHRVDTVLATVGLPVPARRRTVSAVVPTNRPARLEHVLRVVGAQTRPDVELVLVHHGFDLDAAEVRARAKDLGVAELVLVPAHRSLTLGACMDLGVAAASGDVVAKMDDDNHYGPNYLLDLVRAFDWTDAAVVGKWAHYAHLQGSNAVLLRFPDAEHRYVELVQGGTLTVRRETARALGFGNLPRAVDTTFLSRVREAGGRVYSADRFNFVSVRQADVAGHTWQIGDGELLAKRGRLCFYGDPREHVEV